MILKLLYKKYRTDFLDMMVQDLLEDVPDKVFEPALNILAEKKVKVEKLLLYQASILQRRLPKSSKDAERNLGMLIQIKLWMFLLSKSDAPVQTESAAETKSMAQYKQEEADKRTKEFKTIEDFKQRKKLSPEKK